MLENQKKLTFIHRKAISHCFIFLVSRQKCHNILDGTLYLNFLEKGNV